MQLSDFLTKEQIASIPKADREIIEKAGWQAALKHAIEFSGDLDTAVVGCVTAIEDLEREERDDDDDPEPLPEETGNARLDSFFKSVNEMSRNWKPSDVKL